METENRVLLQGRVAGKVVFSHAVHGIDFYGFPLAVPRLSGQEDVVNVLLPAQDPLPEVGAWLRVTGEVRSFNNRGGSGSRLVITVLARTITPGEGEAINQVHLRGRLCKPPVLRRTPLGRDICDLLLAVNRRYHRADYLPCIAWGSLAHRCSTLATGDPLALEGRLQSRVYWKTVGETTQARTAFEISLSQAQFPSWEGPEGDQLGEKLEENLFTNS